MSDRKVKTDCCGRLGLTKREKIFYGLIIGSFVFITFIVTCIHNGLFVIIAKNWKKSLDSDLEQNNGTFGNETSRMEHTMNIVNQNRIAQTTLLRARRAIDSHDANQILKLLSNLQFVGRHNYSKFSSALKDEYENERAVGDSSIVKSDNEDNNENLDDSENDFGDKCKVPNDLKTVEILCKTWPKVRICKSYCALGFAYEDGIMRLHACKKNENTWKSDFEECHPYVSCKAHLTQPGKLKCQQRAANEYPFCQISCDRYISYETNMEGEEVPSALYTCNLDGTWTPPLPRCAENVKGEPIVVLPPDEFKHEKFMYPSQEDFEYMSK